tara:strand:- start:2252 stop:2503 length:252 start_codon:yes stop_codon:yes gene_type:complete
MTDWWQVAFIFVLVGGMWSSYRIGFREGTSSMIDFVKSKSNKQGMTCMHFFGNNIEFIDPLTYNKMMLDKIVEAIEDKDEHSS